MGLRGAVEPELVIEVELSSWSWGPRRLINEVWRGTEDLLSGLRDPPSCWKAYRERIVRPVRQTEVYLFDSM